MNSTHLKGTWDLAKWKLKQKYGSLTDQDLEYVEGQEEELIGRIQRRTRANREEIERFLDGEYSWI